MMHRAQSQTLAFVLASVCMVTVAVQAQTTWYVDDDAPNDPGPGDPTVSDPNENGTSEHPFDAIREGIDAASDGDTVLVLDGAYAGGGNKNLDFGGKPITVRSANGPDNCVIDCQNDGRGLYFHSGEEEASVAEGLTIANGNRDRGGAVYCYRSSPTISDCTITGNSAAEGGGAVYCRENSGPTITDCTITGNSATEDGGAVYCRENSRPTISDCTITGNSASYGGAVYCRENSGPTISDCTITGNSTTEDGGAVYCCSGNTTITGCTISANSASLGGAVYCDPGSRPTITGSTISGNSASYGGAVCCWGGSQTISHCTISGNSARHGGAFYCYSSNTTITACTISANSATDEGGAIECYSYSNPTITGSTISGNSASNHGGAVCCWYSSPTITDCTISGNSADRGGAVYCQDNSTPTLSNCILWADLPEEICLMGSGEVDVTYSDVQGGWPGEGNIDTDPLFVDPDGPDNDPNAVEDNDYRLSSASPCIDAADNTAVPPDMGDLDGDGDTTEPIPMDLDGRLRFADRIGTPDTGVPDPNFPELEIVDMGAYEYQCTGDLNGDGVIDLSDLAQLLANYRTTSGAVYLDGDLDQDGDVDLSDLAALLAVYETTCE